jgi:hypothetical protein
MLWPVSKGKGMHKVAIAAGNRWICCHDSALTPVIGLKRDNLNNMR